MDEKIKKLIELYELANENLLAKLRGMAEGTWSHRRTQELIRQVQVILADLTGTAGEQMAGILVESYKAGTVAAIESMVGQGLVADALETSIKSIIHQKAVQAIADEAFYSILEASDNILKDVKQRIGEIARRANERSLVEGVSRRQATKDAIAELAGRGITGIVTKNGAQVPTDKYMTGVIQYHQRKAHVTGVENMALQNDMDLVYVNFVGITCRHCAGLQGRVYSLSGKDPRFPHMTAERKPPYHSHCVHSMSVWVEEYQSEDEVKRMVAASDPENLGKETRLAKHIKRYDELQLKKSKLNETRKQWIRYKAVLPNDTPDLKSFASQKSRDTAKYQELKELYRSTNAQIKARNDIVTGKYPLKINKQKQGRHIAGTKEYEAYRAKLQKDGFEPAVLQVDTEEILKRFAGKGRIITSTGDNPPKESVNTGEHVGMYFNTRTKQLEPTNWVMIVYSKTGTHVYPKKGDETN